MEYAWIVPIGAACGGDQGLTLDAFAKRHLVLVEQCPGRGVECQKAAVAGDREDPVASHTPARVQEVLSRR